MDLGISAKVLEKVSVVRHNAFLYSLDFGQTKSLLLRTTSCHAEQQPQQPIFKKL